MGLPEGVIDRQRDVVPLRVQRAHLAVAHGDVADVGVAGLVAHGSLPLAGAVGLPGVGVENQLQAGAVKSGSDDFAGFRVCDFLFAPPTGALQQLARIAHPVAPGQVTSN